MKKNSSAPAGNDDPYIHFTLQPSINTRPIDITNITLSPEQAELFHIMEDTNDNVFITGKAGTGKSALLQYFRQKSEKRLAVTAPTGIAALNVGGQTLHSFFRIPPAFIAADSLKPTHKTKTLLQNIDTLVIDEVSMVRADLMDAIDYLLRHARSNDSPFGGVQLVMFGDLYQLPPVVSDRQLHEYFAENHGGYYFFNAHAWQNVAINIFELNTVFRQKDAGFVRLLNAIRLGAVTESLVAELNKRCLPEVPEEGVITLLPTNAAVAQVNNSQLARLEGDEYAYEAEISGDLESSSFPTDSVIRLKEGAQVMFVKNDKEKRWVNGTIGFVKALSGTEIVVDVDGMPYSVPRETWNKVRYSYNREKRRIEEEVVSSFTQYPLKLAWAITIHKSQGQTFGSIVIDIGSGAFSHGQTYVALSRCRSLQGLFLKKKITGRDIIVDPAVVTFMRNANIYKAS